MSGPAWDDDPPGADQQIARNAGLVRWAIASSARLRDPPSFALVAAWAHAPRAMTRLPGSWSWRRFAHGEWVRIHPFANGNGRTARTWANWIAARYGLPMFVSVKPRPASLLYEVAAGASMGSPPQVRGDHGLTTLVFVAMLDEVLSP